MTNILCKGTIIKPKGKKNKMDFLKRAWAEVDLDSIEYNLKEYRRLIGEKTEIMCVVKASCYGHFDNGVVPFLENEMVIRWFAVSNIHEAHRLRDMGIKGEISFRLAQSFHMLKHFQKTLTARYAYTLLSTRA